MNHSTYKDSAQGLTPGLGEEQEKRGRFDEWSGASRAVATLIFWVAPDIFS